MFFTSLEGTLKETQYAWPKVAGDKMEQINENTMSLNQVGYMNGTLFEFHGLLKVYVPKYHLRKQRVIKLASEI